MLKGCAPIAVDERRGLVDLCALQGVVRLVWLHLNLQLRPARGNVHITLARPNRAAFIVVDIEIAGEGNHFLSWRWERLNGVNGTPGVTVFAVDGIAGHGVDGQLLLLAYLSRCSPRERAVWRDHDLVEEKGHGSAIAVGSIVFIEVILPQSSEDRIAVVLVFTWQLLLVGDGEDGDAVASVLDLTLGQDQQAIVRVCWTLNGRF